MTGRWPANVILSPAMAGALDEQSGETSYNTAGQYGARKRQGNDNESVGYASRNVGDKVFGYGDSGGASRFFLTAGYEPWELEWIITNGLTPCGT